MKKITIYTTDKCDACVQVEQILTKHEYQYEVIDVTNNPDVKDFLVKKTGYKGVPVIQIDMKFIFGKDFNAILNALK